MRSRMVTEVCVVLTVMVGVGYVRIGWGGIERGTRMVTEVCVVLKSKEL
ncbi:hypothetical protein Hanom_Chr00s001323g01679961 [Helianthus anomalus]